MSNDPDLSVFGADLLHRFACRLAEQTSFDPRSGVRFGLQDSGNLRSRWPVSRLGYPLPRETRNPMQDARPNVISNSGGSVQMLDGFGVEFHFLKASELNQLGLTTITGILVTAVAIGSLAEHSGLRVGMVISSINRSESGLIDEGDESHADSPRKCRWLMQVWSGEGPRWETMILNIDMQ